VRYSFVVVGAVGDFWRSKTMTAPVDPVETIFWHRRLTTKTRLPRARIGARYFPTFHRTLRLRLQRRGYPLALLSAQLLRQLGEIHGRTSRLNTRLIYCEYGIGSLRS